MGKKNATSGNVKQKNQRNTERKISIQIRMNERGQNITEKIELMLERDALHRQHLNTLSKKCSTNRFENWK